MLYFNRFELKISFDMFYIHYTSACMQNFGKNLQLT